MPGGITGPIVTGVHKDRNLALQVWVLETKADGPCSVKTLLLRNPEKLKPDAIWQNLLRKFNGSKGAVLPMMMIYELIQEGQTT
jgi:hypothetical protein